MTYRRDRRRRRDKAVDGFWAEWRAALLPGMSDQEVIDGLRSIGRRKGGGGPVMPETCENPPAGQPGGRNQYV